MKMNMKAFVISALGTILKGLIKKLEDVENRSRDHPDGRIIRISQNTEKRPG